MYNYIVYCDYMWVPDQCSSIKMVCIIWIPCKRLLTLREMTAEDGSEEYTSAYQRISWDEFSNDFSVQVYNNKEDYKRTV